MATSIASPHSTAAAIARPAARPSHVSLAPQPMDAADASVFGVVALLWVIGAWFYQRLWRA